jgi:hypothetical protein
MKKGFVVLSHQGLTMVGAIAEQLRSRDLAVFVVSSRSARGLTADWLEKVDKAHFVDSLSLTHQDVVDFLQTIDSEVQVMGCISVWDGYRELMAQANERLGASDVPAEVVRLLRDKLAFRHALHARGLSRKRAQQLDAQSFASLQSPSTLFIKPRTGLASFGAFRADKVTCYQELEEIWALARTDLAYDGVFAPQAEFIAEDFIAGQEFSFEVSVRRGLASVHAVHEKVDLTAFHRTILENACLCPPRSLEDRWLTRGIDLVKRVLQGVGVTEGVYHVEARHDSQQGWEIIEANPRIGGAYIVDSTRLHRGVDLIGRWIDLIAGRDPAVASSESRSTFFRVFFGEPGMTIERLVRADIGHPVVIDKLFVKEGERLPFADREIFIGQALWDITALDVDLDTFIDSTKNYFSVEYKT